MGVDGEAGADFFRQISSPVVTGGEFEVHTSTFAVACFVFDPNIGDWNLPRQPWSHTSAKSRVADARMLSKNSDKLRKSVAVSVCSTRLRCAARIALYYY